MLTFINLIKLFIGQCKCTRIYNGYNINWINQMNIANCNVTKATYKMNIQIHYTQYTCIVYRIEPRWNWRKYTTIAKRVMWNEWKEMTFEEIVTIFVFHSYIPRKRIWFHSFFFSSSSFISASIRRFDQAICFYLLEWSFVIHFCHCAAGHTISVMFKLINVYKLHTEWKRQKWNERKKEITFSTTCNNMQHIQQNNMHSLFWFWLQ